MSNPKYGDIRDDGFVFNGRRWLSPKANFRWRINTLFHAAKKRALDRQLPFNIDADYLVSIYPKDNLCPVLGVELAFGDYPSRGNSPSIDRIIPALGYTRGNIIFVSNKVNAIKQNASPEEIIKVGEFYQMLEDSE